VSSKGQLILASILLFSAFAGNLYSQGGRAMSFVLKTTAFPDSGTIPKKYTCDVTFAVTLRRNALRSI